MSEVEVEENKLVKRKTLTEQGFAETLDLEEAGDRAYLKLCKQWWFTIFILVSVALAFAEPVLVAFPETLLAQKIVLAASTVLFIFGYISVMVAIEEGTLWERFRGALLGEVWIEIVCLIVGWALIFEEPAIAPLRCFRIFRFVWYTEFYKAEKGSIFEIIFFPVNFFSHLVLQYLEQLGSEFFTTSSKGGIVVLGFFFYMAYLMGVAYWIRTGTWGLISPEGGPNGNVSECDTLPHCFWIMLRLSFWDGSGFDYLKSLMDGGDNVLTAILIFYMCFSPMVLLNGLIGIFSQAFQKATVEDDEEEEEDKEGEKEENETGTKEEKGEKEKGEDDDVLESLQRLQKVLKKLEDEVAVLKK